MHLHILSVAGNPNVGLYGFATDKYCIIGNTFTDDQKKKVAEALKVPVYQTNLCGTPLVGIFASGNEDCLIVPDIILPNEKKLLDGWKIPYKVISTTQTALGNNMLCTDKVALMSKDIEPHNRNLIEKALGVKSELYTIANLHTVGSLAIANKMGCLVTHDATDEEVDELAETLGVPVGIGTVNFGSGFISSGILCNSHGMIVGSSSTGIEISNADEVLGFLEQENKNKKE